MFYLLTIFTFEGNLSLIYSCYLPSCNFGVKLVSATKEKVVTAREVLETGIQAEPFMETALVTLGELALSSENVEEEVIFK